MAPPKEAESQHPSGLNSTHNQSINDLSTHINPEILEMCNPTTVAELKELFIPKPTETREPPKSLKQL